MATRKIRLTLSGTQVESQGPIVDVDFNSVNLDADVDVSAVYGSTTIVKEYTVDVDAGTYNLDIDYKNDDSDRNLMIEKIEYANDGTNYQDFVVLEGNSNLTRYPEIGDSGWLRNLDESNSYILNSSFDGSQPRTDDKNLGYVELVQEPGSNPKYSYYYQINPVTLYENKTATFNITFS